MLEAPPCAECDYGRPPELLPENLEAFELWLAVQTQWRGAGLGVVGLDYTALHIEAGRMAIDLSPCAMAKIRALEHATLEAAAKVKT